jgi:hypothetical protein
VRVELGELCEMRRQLVLHRPLWLSPEIGMGAPLLFSPEAELLYPLRWPLFLLPPDLGVSAHVVLHLAIAAGGAAYLARTFRVRPAGAIAAGMCFALSGVGLNLIDHTGSFLVAASWLPYAWAGARRRRVLVIGWALAACLLAGERPSTALVRPEGR